jgi:SAM-dependent methyltransferase
MDAVPPTPPPDWALPPGVNRGLWHYLHDPAIAAGYDASLAGTSLFALDERFVLEHCPPTGRFIDLGCGTGRMLVPMAQRGNWVLGVDLSESMLQQAVIRAQKAGVPVNLVQANLARLETLADASFDSAACLFSTLGMVIGADTRASVLRGVFRLLRPGGRFVLHVHNLWFNLHTPLGRRWLLSNRVNSWLGREPYGDRVMPLHQGIAGLTLHLFTRREAVRLLRAAGFTIVKVQPISLRPDGQIKWSWWFGNLRAYGYLLAAERPTHC